tara:strand:- start:1145 stop:1750 length:606 start_codon:yes stop_codon:yes gene_type:complete
MGRSDPTISRFYGHHIEPVGDVALLGYTNNNWFDGDLYDLQLKNWNINSDWKLKKNYDTIICTRCAYFAKEPEQFIRRCYEHLNEGGKLYADWGLGDHWRFEKFKIGWVKDDEQEHAYERGNFLWSSVWDDSFLDDPEFKLFEKRVEKFGYVDAKKAMFEEVPSILELNSINKYFKITYNIKALWDDFPQLYILIKGVRNE